MKTISEIIKLSHEFLAKKGVASPRRSAEELLASLLKCKRVDLYLRFDKPLTEEELAAMRAYVKRRGEGEPVEYITKQVDFFGVSLEVDPHVLIPRQETEILLDIAIKQEKPFFEQEVKILDLCTGSGCIAIALKKRFPHLSIWASDISHEALCLARRNAERNGCEINFIQSDLFARMPEMQFDALFCNPPYISSAEMKTLDLEVKGFEPELALNGGQDGLEFFRAIEETAPAYLAPKAKVFFEMGYTQGASLSKIFANKKWTHQQIVQDWSGKERFFFLEIE